MKSFKQFSALSATDAIPQEELHKSVKASNRRSADMQGTVATLATVDYPSVWREVFPLDDFDHNHYKSTIAKLKRGEVLARVSTRGDFERPLIKLNVLKGTIQHMEEESAERDDQEPIFDKPSKLKFLTIDIGKIQLFNIV
jgi:hypothetical protein